MVPRDSFRQFHLNESHQTKVERCWCRCLCPHATPHGAHSGSGGTPGAHNIIRRPSSIHAKRHRGQIPSGTIRPSIASPLVIKQRLSRGRSLSHRPLTNSPLGNFRQLRQIPLTFVPTRGRTIWSTDINPPPRQIRTPTPIDEKPSFPSFPHVGPLYENGPPV